MNALEDAGADARGLGVSDPADDGPALAHGRFVGAAVLIVTTLVAYQRVLTSGQYEFLNIDDQRYVVDNPRVTGGLTRENLEWALTSLQQSNWHPLTWMSWQLDCALFGVSSWGFHLTNLALHVANVVVLFFALYRLTRRWGRSVVVAGLFAVHPLHVESVAWVSERKDLLSTLFFLLTLLAYAVYAARPGWLRYALVVALYALGLMAKSMLVTLPFVLLLLDAWPLARRRWVRPADASPETPTVGSLRLILEKAPLLALAAACAAVTLRAQERMRDVLDPLPLTARLANALVYYVTYLGRTCWPVDLTPYHPNRGVAFGAWPVAGAALLLASISVVAVRTWRRRPYLLVGWLWFLGTLVPVIGVVQVGLLATTDHYTYIPLIGLFIMFVWGGAAVLESARLPRAVSALIPVVALASCVVWTRQQVTIWKTSVTLWQRVVVTEPRDPLVQAFLAQSLEAHGERAEAEEHYALAADLDPTWKMHLAEGLRLEGAGDVWGARRELEAVLRSAPHNLVAVQHLAAQFQKRGEVRDALTQYATWATLVPGDAEPEYEQGILYEQSGDPVNATLHLRRALEIDPSLAPARAALARMDPRGDAAAGTP